MTGIAGAEVLRVKYCVEVLRGSIAWKYCVEVLRGSIAWKYCVEVLRVWGGGVIRLRMCAICSKSQTLEAHLAIGCKLVSDDDSHPA
jgi:hypothetical protein